MIVFFGGSRSIRSLPSEVKARIDSAVSKSAGVVIGDASGVDAEIQRYLKSREAKNVTVYCSKGTLRNNIGNWPVVQVETRAKPKTYEFFAAKDRAMAGAADAALVVWDGESQGTLAQAYRFAAAGKFVSLYVAEKGVFVDLQTREAWDNFVESLPVAVRSEHELRLRKEEPSPRRELFKAAS